MIQIKISDIKLYKKSNLAGIFDNVFISRTKVPDKNYVKLGYCYDPSEDQYSKHHYIFGFLCRDAHAVEKGRWEVGIFKHILMCHISVHDFEGDLCDVWPSNSKFKPIYSISDLSFSIADRNLFHKEAKKILFGYGRIFCTEREITYAKA